MRVVVIHPGPMCPFLTFSTRPFKNLYTALPEKTMPWSQSLPKSDRLSRRCILASTPTFVVVFVLHINYVTGHLDALL